MEARDKCTVNLIIHILTCIGLCNSLIFLSAVGCNMGVSHENFLGATSERAVEEEVLKKVDTYVGMLQYSAEECEGEKVIYRDLLVLPS